MKTPARKIHTLIALPFLGLIASALADIRMTSIFSEHMVLQCDAAVPIWGYADPGEKVIVSFAGQSQTGTADRAGRWSVKLGGLAAGTHGTLTIEGRNRIEIQDVLAGEVWLAAGQSNMQLRVHEAANAAETKASADLPGIRMFTVAHRPAESPATDCEGQWVVCQPDSVGKFSATAFYFARELHAHRSVPVGVINASWGATPIAAWTRRGAMEGRPELAPIYAEWNNKNRPPRPEDATPLSLSKNYPGNLFDGMIAPLIPYALRGAIWYQGENNANSDQPGLYATQLPLLIRDWRQQWGRGNFPFAWVQLPNFQPKKAEPAKWPLVREAMLRTLGVENTGMAVTIDVGEANQIHPKNKIAVGYRLALWARAQVYGETIPYSGPLPVGHKANGNEITVAFSHTDGGLIAHGDQLTGFCIAGADRHWEPAQARIHDHQVILSHPGIAAPLAVRYAWADNPECNLFNGAGLPASPFRTDEWE
ncbi:MAG: sialate O-acetylesterase [Lacunisphaera sp.]|nr:sialate O-acetylesterase [Lacunisphaera sp.]